MPPFSLLEALLPVLPHGNISTYNHGAACGAFSVAFRCAEVLLYNPSKTCWETKSDLSGFGTTTYAVRLRFSSGKLKSSIRTDGIHQFFPQGLPIRVLWKLETKKQSRAKYNQQIQRPNEQHRVSWGQKKNQDKVPRSKRPAGHEFISSFAVVGLGHGRKSFTKYLLPSLYHKGAPYG